MSGRGNDYWVTVSWKPTDPWAVTLSIPHSTSPVDWLLARDLLWSGLNIPTGSGDVRIEPVTARDLDDEDQIEIRLYGRRNARCAHLIVTRRDLWEFLQATKAHFPDARDTARAGIDAEIARLLARPTAAPGEEAT
ncbi:SsgA family sporulation/cell division regulator [Pseudonocardia acaciae]|uniref:SsgA family sporulation/cell division regulator n=1 Tax=Pseudonocardia acaciae TaxID=551276 RepID=UPI000684D171|nr:SsgA family sporulation/cell division regulator [Pseudonocardia acaciae]